MHRFNFIWIVLSSLLRVEGDNGRCDAVMMDFVPGIFPHPTMSTYQQSTHQENTYEPLDTTSPRLKTSSINPAPKKSKEHIHFQSNNIQEHIHILANNSQEHANLLSNKRQEHIHPPANNRQEHIHPPANDNQEHIHPPANKNQGHIYHLSTQTLDLPIHLRAKRDISTCIPIPQSIHQPSHPFSTPPSTLPASTLSQALLSIFHTTLKDKRAILLLQDGSQLANEVTSHLLKNKYTQHAPCSQNAQTGSQNAQTGSQNAQTSTLYEQKSTLNAQTDTLNAQTDTLIVKNGSLNAQNTKNAQTSTLNAQTGTLNAQTGTLNVQTSTLNAHNGILNANYDSPKAQHGTDAQFGSVNLVNAQEFPLSVQIMNISGLDTQDIWDFFKQGGHNSEEDIMLVLFLDAKVVERFLAGNLEWIDVPLLFFSLSDDTNSRDVLEATRDVQHVTLLAPQVTSRGQIQYQVTTLLPYILPPHHIHSQMVTIVDLQLGLGMNQLFMDRHNTFHGHVFYLASWIDDFPYLFYDNEKRVVGIGESMLHEISQRRNFTYKLQDIPPDEYWGELINGSWVGMLGQVVRGEKDFVINGMAVVRDRYLATDFTVPYYSDSYSITLKIPPPFPRWLSVVYPFGPWVWIAVVGVLFLLSIFFHLLVSSDSSRIYNTRADIISSIVWISKTLLRQASPYIPRAPGCRPFLALWWLAGVVLSTSYMGNLIAFLTVPTQTRRIQTLEELSLGDIKLHMLDYGNFVPGYLWSSKEPVLRRLGSRLSLLPDYDQVLDAFDNGAGVLEATEYSQFLFISRRRSRGSYAVEEKLYPNYVGWVFRKGSPYKHIFDRYLSWMSQSGLVGQWRRIVINNFQRSRATGEDGEEEELTGDGIRFGSVLQPLSLEHLQGAFIVLGLGSSIALIALAVELLMFSWPR